MTHSQEVSGSSPEWPTKNVVGAVRVCMVVNRCTISHVGVQLICDE